MNVNIYFGVNRRFLEKYPRGRRGSPAKGVVRVNRSQGSNPCFSANTLKPYCSVGFFVVFLQGFPCFARGNVVAEPCHRQLHAPFSKTSFFTSLLSKSLLLRQHLETLLFSRVFCYIFLDFSIFKTCSKRTYTRYVPIRRRNWSRKATTAANTELDD